MVRRVVRWMLWGVKGLLLAVAMGAVFLWWWSYGHSAVISRTHWTSEGNRMKGVKLAAAWWDGRIAIYVLSEMYDGDALAQARQLAEMDGPNAQWRVDPNGTWMS